MKKQTIYQIVSSSIIIAILLTVGILTKQSPFKIFTTCLSIIMLSFLVKGSIIAFPIGIVYYSLYTYICFTEKVYGAAILNIACSIPIQIISLISWIKASKKIKQPPTFKKMPNKWRLILASAVLIITAANFFILNAVGSISPLLDSASMISSIAALILIPLRYIEQWVFNALGNFLGLLLWITTLFTNISNINIVIVFFVFTINSIVGLFSWIKIYKTQKNK